MWSFHPLLPLISHIYTHPPSPDFLHQHSLRPPSTTNITTTTAVADDFPTINSNHMGNCQAIDNASLLIQHPNGKVERLYSAISAADVMNLNPGHYVALLLTTTLYSSRPPPTATAAAAEKVNNPRAAGATATTAHPLRITRIKLLRHTENLTVGHVYRLITTQEVMKEIMAKKNGKNSNNPTKPLSFEDLAGKLQPPATIRSDQSARIHHQIKMKKSEKDQRSTSPVKSSAGGIKPRGWHPSLNSISEMSS